MVQQINRSSLVALRIGDASAELSRIASTPYGTPIGFDLETTGKNPRMDKLVMIQLKPKGRKTLIIDARDADKRELRTALLALLRDPRRTFTGQNLLFELHWMLSYLGMEVNDLRARFEDTMLRELVILGLGFGDARKRGLAVNMHDIGERYGIPVHKEERSWFIDLDKRVETLQAQTPYDDDEDPDDREWEAEHTDDFEPVEYRPWDEPFPQAQLEYARQDVSVVHLIAERQQALIDEYGLQEVVDLEARVLPATAGMQHYGLAVNREKWLEIIDGIDQAANDLARKLHAEIDIPVLEHRRQEWLAKSEPYLAWVKQRDEALDVLKYTWEHTGSQLVLDGSYKGWGDYKKQGLQQWKEANPQPKSPQALKDGVNLDSPAQILTAMRSRGHAIDSVKEELLTPLAASDLVVQLYLDYKDYATARTKFGLAFLEEHAPLGVLYSFIQQVGTETGRYAFKEPNVQQIPARGAAEHIREAIIPRPGYVFVDADFTNVELMIAAYVTRDPVMLKAFADREDLHARTAEVMFGLRSNPEYLAALAEGITPKFWTDNHNAVVGGKQLGKTYRSIAKTINFGLLYGMGAGKLSSQLRIDISVAKQLMSLYRQTYQVAVRWLRQQGQKIENPDQDGRVYASTLAGRRRWFTLPVLQLDKNTTATEAQEALDKHNRRKAEIQRQLGNHPIQGTSADTTKLTIADWQEKYNSPEMHLVCTIHDELLLEVKNNPATIELAKKRLGECMHRALTHFLKDMDIPVPQPIVADYWKH